MQNSLDRLPLGITGTVLRVNCKQGIRDRLQELGFIPGTKVIVRYRSPDKGVIAVEFRGAVIAMRSRNLKGVLVEWI